MIEIDPNKQYLLNKSIISANMSLGQNELALKQLNRLINDNPQFTDLLFTRAQILLSLKQFDKAKTNIDVLLSKDADNYAHIQLLAQYYIATGNQQGFAQQREKGIRILSQSFDKNPQNVELLFELASLYSNLRDYDNALKQYNIILSKYPQNYEALKQSARIRLNMQQWNQAISLYEILETNYFPEEEFLNNKAIACIQIGDYRRALEYFEKLIEMDPYNKEAIYNRNKLKKEHSL
jgi:tetratricopeptide (TPR) repeat protein